MGGFGSGRRAIQPCLEVLCAVRSKPLREACGFRPGMSGRITFGGDREVAIETHEGAITLNGTAVRLAWTSPHFGGRRTWFLCPRCHQRCTVVYGESKRWACRRCWRANYASQKEDRFDRLIRRAQKLRRRLGDTVVASPIDHVELAGFAPTRPLRMHGRTYRRLTTELEQLEGEAAALFYDKRGRLLERLHELGGFWP